MFPNIICWTRVSRACPERLAKVLKKIKGRFILSYNDYPDIWRLYEDLQFKQVEGRYSIQHQDRWVSFGELNITNF